MNARVKQQGGWAGSFVIVGIVLAVLLVGGVYALKSYNVDNSEELNSRDNEQTAQPSDEKEQSTDKTHEKKDADRTKTDDSSDEATTDTGATTDDTATQKKDDTSAQDLPQTGPADTAISLTIFTILAYATVAYLRSRRHATL